MCQRWHGKLCIAYRRSHDQVTTKLPVVRCTPHLENPQKFLSSADVDLCIVECVFVHVFRYICYCTDMCFSYLCFGPLLIGLKEFVGDGSMRAKTARIVYTKEKTCDALHMYPLSDVSCFKSAI